MRHLNYTKIAIADSDFYFKEVIIKSLVSPFHSIVKNCNNGYELISQLHRKIEEIFFIDLFMPVMSGMEAIKYIRATGNNAPIIAYSSVFQEDVSELLQKYTNIYYCQKKVTVVLDIYKNYVVCSTKKYDDYFQKWKQQPMEVLEYIQRQNNENYRLSTIEIQIMKFAYQGLSNKEIGNELHLSTRTIDTYIARLIKKLQLRNKIDLVRFCVEQGYYNYND
ncbi:response regulator transcription factor [Capnocytophaga canimorsus]|uniref:DNA-binding response regulator n=1 Tax=Capnocytophaga canis TaxID=1848903 RepID=A0A3A1YBU5_9FLAO|nr:response regulator transcription factor [Capnocytophaga canis]RIY35031.1 DNA-binding response regulator [Capnocytophaga canis]